MKISIFGKTIFQYQKEGLGEMLSLNAREATKELKNIPDFYRNIGDIYSSDPDIGSYISFSEQIDALEGAASGKKKKKKLEPPKKKTRTPKGVYEMKLLHDESVKINTNPEYVDGQIADFKEKLALLTKNDRDMRNGTHQISSIILRMENRKQYADFKDFFDQYPYTTTERIKKVIDEHENLKIDLPEQFIADMPNDAIQAMKDYNKSCKKLCGKEAVFYLIADEKDFKRTQGRKDPILLAQSPYGHVWQILGAWDEEMLLLDEL